MNERGNLEEKIAKLERLANNNPNVNEAASARAKAEELKQRIRDEEWEGCIHTLNRIEYLAYKHEFYARQLRSAVVKCKNQRSLEGLDEMVAMSFNAQQFTPQYGGGGSNLPPGKYKGVIVNSAGEQSTKGGGFLALHLTPIEGPLAGQVHIDRLNLHHTNPQTVEIANKQLSAYCHVLGKFQFNDTAELHNIPFMFEIGFQKGQEPTAEKPNGGYTEVKAIFDANGNEPGKAGAGPQTQQQQPPQQPPQTPPPGGVAPQGQPQGGGWGNGAPQQQQQPPQQQGGWGAGAPQQQQPGGAPPWGPQ